MCWSGLKVRGLLQSDSGSLGKSESVDSTVGTVCPIILEIVASNRHFQAVYYSSELIGERTFLNEQSQEEHLDTSRCISPGWGRSASLGNTRHIEHQYLAVHRDH